MTNEISLYGIESLMEKISAYDKLSPRLARFEKLIREAKKKDDKFSRCINYLEMLSAQNQIQLFYVGGFLRDLWLGLKPRDIDIIFNSLSQRSFEFAVNNKIVRRNRFDGLKLNIYGVNVDAWPIEKTWTFENNYVLPKSINRFPETTFLTVESLALEVYAPFDSRQGFEKGFFKACKEKVLELQRPENPFPNLQLIRTYSLQKKLEWKVGLNLREFIKRQLETVNPNELATLYEEHYNKKINGQTLYNSIRNLID